MGKISIEERAQTEKLGKEMPCQKGVKKKRLSSGKGEERKKKKSRYRSGEWEREEMPRAQSTEKASQWNGLQGQG